MKMWAVILALAVAMALLPGFREKSEITDKVVVTAIGIDAGKDKEFHLSVQAIEPLKTSGSLSEQEDNATKVYEIEDLSVSGAMQSFVTDTGRDTYILHNKIIALSLDMVQSYPLLSLLDYFMRNHESRPTVDLVICRGKAADLLNLPSASYPIPAEQISKLLQEGQRWGTALQTSLLDTERNLSGMADAVIPIVRVEGEGEDAVIFMDGSALFRDGVFAGELDEQATRGLLFARDEIDRCLYTPALSSGELATVEIHDSSTSLSVAAEGNIATYTFQVKAKAEITEISRRGGLKETQIEELRSKTQELIAEDLRRTLHVSVDQLGCDTVGFGRMTSQYLPDIIRGKEDQWKEKLKDCRFSIKVDVEIDRSGMTDWKKTDPPA